MENSVIFNLPDSIVLEIIQDNPNTNSRVWEWKFDNQNIEVTEQPLGVVKDIKYPEGFAPDEDTKRSLRSAFDEFISAFEAERESGIEPGEQESIEIINKFPYDPKKIKISSAVWSVASVAQYLEKGIINLSPDFQRNFVWDTTRQSQLIESILLGIPVPAFYLAKSGRSHQVVDGLQRLTTIGNFVSNKFPLKNLEYLNDKQELAENNLEGCYYKGKRSLGDDYEFALTGAQLHFNIIDEQTPTQVKFDIFRRLNTGGKPLNAQEIRNCMMEEPTRKLVNNLVQIFLKATNNSVGTTRMNAHELIMRFIAFWYEKKLKPQNFNYQGNMQSFLDEIVDRLNKDQGKYHATLTNEFDISIKNSVHLFGPYCFRKCLPEHLQPGARTQLVNKSLFTTWSVLLSEVAHERVSNRFPTRGDFATILAKDLDESRKGRFIEGQDVSYYDAVSYRTNDRIVLQIAFDNTKRLIDQHINI